MNQSREVLGDIFNKALSQNVTILHLCRKSHTRNKTSANIHRTSQLDVKSIFLCTAKYVEGSSASLDESDDMR